MNNQKPQKDTKDFIIDALMQQRDQAYNQMAHLAAQANETIDKLKAQIEMLSKPAPRPVPGEGIPQTAPGSVETALVQNEDRKNVRPVRP